ncbi:MAG: ATP-dependent DNA helicase DinG, partial [Lysobacterales bacterium]
MLAKGRRRYVCLSRLDKALDLGAQEQAVIPLYPDEFIPAASSEALPVYTEMLDALGRGEWDGDRDNWPREIPEDIWFGVTTDHRQCTGRRCPNVGQCSFFRARDALQNTDVIVTNHDLVLSDLALGGGVILSAPEETIYIFDEGHHLPDIALNHFSGFCRLSSSQQWAEECKKQLALAAAQRGFAEFSSIINRIPGTLDEVVLCLNQVEQVLEALVEPEALAGNFNNQHYRLPHGHVPEGLRLPGLNLAQLFDKLVSDFQRLERGMEDAMDGELAQLGKAEAEGWFSVFGAMLSRAEGNQQLWQAYAVSGEADEPPMARWINVLSGNGQAGFELRCSPILAAGILQEYLWERAAAVVATSATMTALNSFERFILHSGAPRSGIFKVVPSPFDYSNATLRVPAMDCDPGDPEAHTQAIIELLPELLEGETGSLVLFSSRRQMSDVYAGLPGTVREQILLQGDYSKQETLRRHREAIDAGVSSAIFGL